MTSPEPNINSSDPVPVSAQEFVPAPGENPPWNLWDVARLAVVAFLATALFGVIALSIAAHGNTSRELVERLALDPKIVVPSRMLAYLLIFGYMVAVVRLAGREFWEAVRWDFPGRAAIGYVALGVALAILIQTVSAFMPIPKSLPIDKFFSDTAGAYLMAVFGISFAPFVEELFFRGFLYPALARKAGNILGVSVTALLFALIHAEQLAHAWAPLLLLWLVGVALTSVRAWTKSVGASFCVHVGYNTTLFTLIYLATDHFRNLEKLK